MSTAPSSRLRSSTGDPALVTASSQRRDAGAMDVALRHLADSQAGLFTTAQAAAVGWSTDALACEVRAGTLVHLGRALYAVPGPDVAHPEGRHLLLCRGGLLLYPGARLSHASAVLALGLPWWGVQLKHAYLARPELRHQVRTQSFVIDRCSDAAPVQTAVGAAEPPDIALVQHTLAHGVTPGVVAMDAALHKGLLTRAMLDAACARVNGWPRSSRVASALALVDGRSESVGESLVRVIATLDGLELDPQVEIRDASGAFVGRVDFLLRGTRVAIEFDGLVKYRVDGHDALVAEKRREDALRACGYFVVRLTWADLHRPGLVAARIRAGLSLARRAGAPVA